MENQKKKFGKRKEGDPRISVRPGNFIIPGEKPQEKRSEAPAPVARATESTNAAPRGDGDAKREEARSGAGQRHGRHRGNRRGRGHGNGGEQRNTARNIPQNGAQNPSVEEKKDGQKQSERREDRRGGRQQASRQPSDRQPSDRQQSDRQNRRGDSRRPSAPKAQDTADVQISDSLQRELDAQFVSLPSLSTLSPVALAEKRMKESAVDTKEFEVDIATAAYLVEDIPCGFPVPDGKAVEVIGVRFRQAGKIYFFSPNGARFKIGEPAIVDTARGPEFGEVVLLNRKMAEKDIIQPLRAVLRRATEEDIAHEAENRRKEAEALKICAEKIAAHKLEMNLVDAQYTFDNSKLLFYFTSEGRVDFRELVRDLAGVFRTRIELRQIGIRDESRLIGGLGMCGRPFCCTTFLSDFGQVSVKMAKEQGLSINTSKISGCCGRLMCCLRYEHESYAKEAALTPKKDTRVMTPDGPGTVVDATPLSGMVKVKRDDAAEEPPTAYHRDTLQPLEKKAEGAPADNEA